MRLVVAAFVCCWGGLWCPPTAAQTAGPPQIAVLLPLSGDLAGVGEMLLEAVEMGLADNPGLSWTVLDTGGDPSRTRRHVRSLAENPAVVAILGPVGAATSEAAAEVASEAGLPLLTLTSRDGVERASRHVFRLRVSPRAQARAIARLALDDLGLRRFAVLHPEDEYGRSATRAFVDAITRDGRGTVTAVEAYEADSVDMNGPVELLVGRRYRQLVTRRGGPATRSRLLSSTYDIDFQALFVPYHGRQAALIAPFLAFWEVPLGRRTQLLGLSSWQGRDLQASGPLLEGALFTAVYDPALYAHSASDLALAFEEQHERSPSEAEVQTYDAVCLLAAAIGSLDRFALSRSALSDVLLGFRGSATGGGAISFDASGAVVRELTLFAVDRRGVAAPHTVLR